MALLQASIFSQTLKRTVPLMVVLPSDKVLSYGGELREEKPCKTLYLLHGLLGSYTDWVSNTNIQRLAEDRNLAVIMPSGENSFYVDQPVPNNDFGEYIGKELVELTRGMFPLSPRREDTFIAGLSMGGFGAIRNGLKYYDTFGYIAGLSSAVQIFELPLDAPGCALFKEDACFGNLTDASLSDKNPRVAFERLAQAKKQNPSIRFPEIYMACGSEDTLSLVNRSLADFLIKGGVHVTWAEAPGGHNWAFWQSQIIKVLDWLPLDENTAGISSGNVR